MKLAGAMKQIEIIDKIYRDTPLERIPWNVETPPTALVELVDGGTVTPCKTIDLGCGAGNHALYLASRGFNVTGVDISPTAIKRAKENVMKRGVTCTFLVVDVLGDLKAVTETFDFAYDWELLHHIFPEQRGNTLKTYTGCLIQGGSTSLSASVRRIPNLVDQENIEQLH
jgi:2-polyprenyl-3-methyl-5-hydroxy-6-metoxy-1,4-benzoquinol methylase